MGLGRREAGRRRGGGVKAGGWRRATQKGIKTSSHDQVTVPSTLSISTMGRQRMTVSSRVSTPHATPPCAIGESIHAGTPAASIICMPWSPYRS